MMRRVLADTGGHVRTRSCAGVYEKMTVTEQRTVAVCVGE